MLYKATTVPGNVENVTRTHKTTLPNLIVLRFDRTKDLVEAQGSSSFRKVCYIDMYIHLGGCFRWFTDASAITRLGQKLYAGTCALIMDPKR